MKRAYFSLLLIIFSSICNAQKLTDNYKYKATYELTWQIDSTDVESIQNETMVLFIGDQISRFSSEGNQIADSIQNVYKGRGKNSRVLVR